LEKELRVLLIPALNFKIALEDKLRVSKGRVYMPHVQSRGAPLQGPGRQAED